MRFGNPRMLWLLAVAVPLLLWFLVWAWRKRQQLIARFVQSRLLALLTVGVSRRRQRLRLALVAAAAILMMLALARPQHGFAWEQVHTRGLDILVAVDTSRSMLATDLAPNRLARAKLAALDLMRAARTDRLGLIAFAGSAFLQCPLTLDDNAFSENVNYLNVGLLPQGGTALAEAIDTAVRAFKGSGDNFKVLVLLTDGEDHEEGVVEAAERAAKEGIHIFPVGIATLEGDRIRVEEEGKASYIKDEDGKIVVSKLNMDLLQKVAQATVGDYLTMRGADTMKVLYESRLAPLPRSEISSRLFRQYHEKFQWPLGLAVLCLIAEMFVSERRRVERSDAIMRSGNVKLKKMVGTAVFLLGLSGVSLPVSAANPLEAYQAGRYKESQREYKRLLKRNPDDPRLHYNAGTAAYRAGDLGQATNALSAATLASDPKLLQHAYYNLGNASYRLGEQADDPSQTIEHWKRALANYDSALKLDSQDQDAKFNRDLVARKLEELQKQQQPQPNQDKSDQDQKDPKSKQPPPDQSEQQQQKDQQEKQDQQQDQQRQDDQTQPQAQPKQDTQNQPDQKEQEEQDHQQSQDDRKQDRAKPDQDQVEPNPAGKQEKSAGEEQGEGQATLLPGQMTPDQARQLLEAARAEERPWVLVPPDVKRRTRTYREW